MTHFIFTLDFETDRLDAQTAHAVEVGLASPEDGAYAWQSLVRLPEGVELPPEVSAVHHIIAEDLDFAPSWSEVLAKLRAEVFLPDGSLADHVVLAAHNADYERGVLRDEKDLLYLPWICTYKVALRLWPDAPSHKNEGLRYWLKIGQRGRQGPKEAHSALHDARVTAGILSCALDAMTLTMTRENAIAEMIAWTREPARLPRCPLGKHVGQAWDTIPASYLQWMVGVPDMREDAKHCARVELERRKSHANA